jgi:hypothetical protein
MKKVMLLGVALLASVAMPTFASEVDMKQPLKPSFVQNCTEYIQCGTWVYRFSSD